MLSFDDLELTGDDKINADLQYKEFMAKLKKENEAKQKLDSERFSRELRETNERLYNQQRQYKEMMIDVQVEAMKRIEAEKKKPVNEQRNDDFTQSKNETKSDLNNLLKAPSTRQNDWAEVINEMANRYNVKHGELPTQAQAWSLLCTQPPTGYVIKTGKDKGEVCLMMEGCEKSLSKSAFNKRWRRYTKQSPTHQT